MKLTSRHITLFLLTGLLVLLSFARKEDPRYQFVIPKGWPKPTYDFKRNKVSEAGFVLGRTLFNDPILSKDNSVSCASCHLNFTAFTHADHNVSHGIYGLKGTRNSLALFNLAWNKTFMWDGRVTDLEGQPTNPITNQVEMDNSMDSVVAKLNRSGNYRKLFYTAFKDSVITPKTLLKSLAQFTVMLESFNSKYDSVIRSEPGVAFTENELKGYNLFKQHCASCHTEPLFTNNAFKNNGLLVDTALRDFGRMSITHQASDSLLFRVPSLRNIGVSGPYMHDGRFGRLKDVVEHYTSGTIKSPTLSHELENEIRLSTQDKKDLISFLNTLTDKYFLYDVRFRSTNPY